MIVIGRADLMSTEWFDSMKQLVRHQHHQKFISGDQEEPFLAKKAQESLFGATTINFSLFPEDFSVFIVLASSELMDAKRRQNLVEKRLSHRRRQ